jgi:hypothetical protein
MPVTFSTVRLPEAIFVTVYAENHRFPIPALGCWDWRNSAVAIAEV